MVVSILSIKASVTHLWMLVFELVNLLSYMR